MKRYITFRYLSWALVFLLAACETDPRILTADQYAVRFTDTGVTLKESYAQLVRIEVHNVGPALPNDVTISYKVSGSAREGVDYNIVGEARTVTIPAGQYFGYIEVELINNSNNILRTQDVVFTLKRIDSDDRTVGEGTGAIGTVFTLSIQDDCILGGPYTGSTGTFSSQIKGLTITSADCITYTLSNWNFNYLQYDLPYEFPLTFTDNNDNTITIDEQDIGGGATISGTGVVDPITRQIKIQLDIVDYYTKPVTVNFTLTPVTL